MRICFFTDTFLPQINGVVTSVLTLAEELAARGHEVLIIAPRGRGERPRMAMPGVTVRLLTSLPALLYPEFRIGAFPSMAALRAVRRFRPDVIHVHTPLTVGLDGVACAKALGVPLVGTNHVFLTRENARFLRSLKAGRLARPFLGGALRYMRAFYGACDLRTAPSQLLTEQLSASGHGPYVCLANPVRLAPIRKVDDAARARIAKTYGLRERVVLHVGRLSAEKSVDVVLRAFARLPERSDATLLIVGDGPARCALEQLASKLGIGPDVVFTGALAHDALLQSGLLSVADVFITASTMENQSMAVLEAMGAGLPIVAVGAAGMPALVRGNGFLAKEGDSEALAKCIRKILNDGALQKALAAVSRKLAEEHAPARVVDQLTALYERASDQRKKRR